MPTLRKTMLALALMLPLAANAQVYRCEVNGKRVFMDQPCSRDAEPIEVAPASGDYDPAAGRQASERTAAELRRERAADEAARRTEERRSLSAAAKPKSETRCEQIARERASAQYWSQEFRHPDNIRREQDKLKHFKERDFMECGRVF